MGAEEIRELIAEARTDISDAERCEMLGITPSAGTLLRMLRKTVDALAALTTPQEAQWEHGVIAGDDLLARLMDTLAYYHCRSVNPKADSPYLGYHAMSEDQREFLRERQREAAEEVLRMWQSEPGWEFGLRWNGDIVRSGNRETVEGYFEMWGGQIVRRRKAGPWLPVGDDDGA